MNQITLNNRVYKIHPAYYLYAADEDGNVIDTRTNYVFKGNESDQGYVRFYVDKYFDLHPKSYYIHRFVWECFNGLILDGRVINHVNGVRNDNRLCNLRLIIHQENCKKRDNSFVVHIRNIGKGIKATNYQTNVVRYFRSMYACQQRLGINVGLIKMICEGKKGYKTGLSTKDCCRYVFEYYKPE